MHLFHDIALFHDAGLIAIPVGEPPEGFFHHFRELVFKVGLECGG